MVSDFVIMEAIERLVIRHYIIWTIGVTDDPEGCRQDLGNPNEWYYWNANSKTKAKKIQIYFLKKGMAGAREVGENPNYVFIYLG